MQKYDQIVPNRATTPQSQPLPGQVPNAAGGFVWSTTAWQQLDRFLILGSVGGTYYISERQLTKQNVDAVRQCIAEDGAKVVERIVQVSGIGLAPNNDPALYALAMCASADNPDTVQAALAALPLVARIPTHLFHFVQFVRSMRGWGRGLRRAVGSWYTARTPLDLAYATTKYQSRDGWSNRDLLKLAHPKNATPAQNAVIRRVLGKPVGFVEDVIMHEPEVKAYLEAVDALQKATPYNAGQLIRNHRLPREVVPTELLTSSEVWAALLDKMPATALLRNLATMTRVGLIGPMAPAVAQIAEKFACTEWLRESRLHPMTILLGLKTYASGHGVRGGGVWEPHPAIIDVLDRAFYASFATVVPTGKRTLVALDVSGSMQDPISGNVMSCAEAGAAMALVLGSTEPLVHTMAFNTGPESLPISKGQRLDDVLRRANIGGGTDISVPFLFARQQNIPVDTFVILTDNETWAGRQHPQAALEAYRKASGIQSRAVILSMAANASTVGDPKDLLVLNAVGFDASVPTIVNAFSRGDF